MAFVREFPGQRVSNAENVSIWWRHHDDSNTALFNSNIVLYFLTKSWLVEFSFCEPCNKFLLKSVWFVVFSVLIYPGFYYINCYAHIQNLSRLYSADVGYATSNICHTLQFDMTIPQYFPYNHIFSTKPYKEHKSFHNKLFWETHSISIWQVVKILIRGRQVPT